MTLPRPRTVIYGVVCMAVSLVIGSYIIAIPWRAPDLGLFCFALVGLLTAYAWFWGWARWVIALLAVSSVVIAWDLVLFQLTHRASMALLTATQYTLELLGFVLLFHPASTRWYRRKGSARLSTADPGAPPRG